MPELSESIKAIQEGAKEDRFTYLTILQYHVTSPEALPTLNEVLQDAELTQEIGWDLVQMLLNIQGSETCLETVARLGNPREVVIKVMEALEGLTIAWNDEVIVDVDDPGVIPDSNIPGKFITLLGMLAILHRRIKTKYPSRFLGPSLVKVFEAYQPMPEMTASVINLVYSLSGRKRPPLPSRKSSVTVANPDQDGDASKNAPDPEAEQEDPNEDAMQSKLLQSFVTCILQRYVNALDMLWSPRLLEAYNPEKLIPGKKTTTEAFRENEELQNRDAVVGHLVALLRDLGLDKCPGEFVKSILDGPTHMDPLAAFDDFSSVDEIHLSPGGTVCLIAYWIFSKDVFGSDSPQPEMHIFPDHVSILARFLGREVQAEILASPGIADAMLAIGLGLQHRKLIKTTKEINLMAYLHNLTLISVFHTDIQVRNAAASYAGSLLHSEPDDQIRLEILEDLLENCGMFPSLKACAVAWLKEELITAKQGNQSNQFSSPDVIERLQYFLFPDMQSLNEMGTKALIDFWSQNHMFLLQVANFAYFLFAGCTDLVPAGMGAAVGQRFVEPIVAAADKLQKTEGTNGEDNMQLGILTDRLRSLGLQ
ncbi:DUF1760-domain-containing protein [Hypoxylon sp. NC1633]|nr:DUF1760-domain-containing protein [Hypoxylon sp. NC1633]